MVDLDSAPLGTDAPASTPREPVVLDRGPGLALAAFVVVEIAAAALFLVQGRHQWFFLDEWDFLVTRSGTSPADLLRPHYEHWTTAPILVYRALWSLFGIHSYLPYQVVLVALHLGVAAMLRTIMRRAAVGPWIATLAASVLALFGSGQENVVWAFQITFTGSLLFGLVQLVLADHDGRVDRRDWLGLLAGLTAIMCAGPGLVMVAVVGAATWLRRGWKLAAFHCLPLATVYGLWAITLGQESEYSESRPTARAVATFVGRGLSATFEAIGQARLVGGVLAAVLILGLIVAFAAFGRDEMRRHRVVPIALLLGTLAFLVITAVGRAGYYGAERAEESRYLYMVAAMILPALGVAIDAIVRQWPAVSPVAVVLLLVGVPGNVAAADDRSPLLRGTETYILTLPQVWNAETAPDSTRPDGALVGEVTLGWLKQGVDERRVPAPDERVPQVDASAQLTIGLAQQFGPQPTEGCLPLTSPVERQLDVGNRLTFSGARLRITVLSEGHPLGATAYDASLGNALVAVAELPRLRLQADDRRNPPTVCG